jgi:hypothetical protein
LDGALLNREAVVIEEKGRLWDAFGHHFAYKRFLIVAREKGKNKRGENAEDEINR